MAMSIFTLFPRSFKLNEGPQNIDMVLYLYMRIIFNKHVFQFDISSGN